MEELNVEFDKDLTQELLLFWIAIEYSKKVLMNQRKLADQGTFSDSFNNCSTFSRALVMIAAFCTSFLALYIFDMSKVTAELNIPSLRIQKRFS